MERCELHRIKRQAGSALIQNFEAVRGSLEAMEDSLGSSDKEMSVVEQTLEYKINALKQTWVGTVQEMIKRGDLGAIIDSLTKLSASIGKVVDTFGLLGTVGLGAGIFAGIKNVGKRRSTMFHNCFEYADRDRCSLCKIGFLSPIVKYTMVNEATISVEIT